MNPKLSLCAIVKNEAKNLPRCLNSVKNYVDEIVVVDTGSTDGTPEIALSYGAKVKHFQWCDDFSAARNYAISQASGDWILMLDADEELVVESNDFLAEVNLQPEVVGYFLSYIEINDRVKLTPSYRMCLFRNIPNFKYVGCFHELLQYDRQDEDRNIIGNLNSLKVLHYGFSTEHKRQKNIDRDIPMLERIAKESGLSLRLLGALAEMYSENQQPEKARECYAEAFDRLLPNLLSGNKPQPFTFVASLIYALGIQSITQKDEETARLLGQRGLEWCHDYPPLNYLAAGILREWGFPLGAIAYFENCLRMGREGSYYKGEPFTVNFMTTYPAYEMGCTYLEMCQYQLAIAAFELTLSFDPNFTTAREKLTEINQLLTTQA